MENKNLTFEQANELLEKTVSKMESGELTLEQTMEEYAKACELLAYCMKQLEQCKGKIIDINERISKLSRVMTMTKDYANNIENALKSCLPSTDCREKS